MEPRSTKGQRPGSLVEYQFDLMLGQLTIDLDIRPNPKRIVHLSQARVSCIIDDIRLDTINRHDVPLGRECRRQLCLLTNG